MNKEQLTEELQSINEKLNPMVDAVEYMGWKANKESLKETIADIAAYQAGTAPDWFDEKLYNASIKEAIHLKEQIKEYQDKNA